MLCNSPITIVRATKLDWNGDVLTRHVFLFHLFSLLDAVDPVVSALFSVVDDGVGTEAGAEEQERSIQHPCLCPAVEKLFSSHGGSSSRTFRR